MQATADVQCLMDHRALLQSPIRVSSVAIDLRPCNDYADVCNATFVRPRDPATRGPINKIGHVDVP